MKLTIVRWLIGWDKMPIWHFGDIWSHPHFVRLANELGMMNA
jgi:hypothetical protein